MSDPLTGMLRASQGRLSKVTQRFVGLLITGAPLMLVSASTHAITEDAIRSLNRIDGRWNNDIGGQIVAVTSRVEALADRFIDLLVLESGVGSTQLGKNLLREYNDSFHQSWPARNGILKKGFGIQAASMPIWDDMELVIEVRNAIVHGDGGLTNRQLKDSASLITMRKRISKLLHSDIQGRMVRLSDEAGVLSAEIAIKYAVALDEAVSLVRPALDA